MRRFVNSFDTLENQEAVLAFHNRADFVDILFCLDDILGADPVLAPLKEEVHEMFIKAKGLPPDHLEERIELEVRAMDRFSQYVRALEKIESPVAQTPEGVSAGAHVDAAQDNGGIDVRNISVNRQGTLDANVVSGQALEDMLKKASGLRGIITGITPIQNLSSVLGLSG